MMGLAAVCFGAAWRDLHLPIPAAVLVALAVGCSRRRAERGADFAAAAAGADRDARHVLAVSRRRRRHHRSGGELQRVSAGISRARPGVYLWGVIPAQLPIFLARADRVFRSAASIGHRPRAVCDRLQRRRRAVRRHSGREPSRPRVSAVGHRVRASRRSSTWRISGRRDRMRETDTSSTRSPPWCSAERRCSAGAGRSAEPCSGWSRCRC